MATDALLQVRGLEVRYGSSQVLQGIDLAVGRAPLAVLGRNGMGKTTLCAAVMGLTPAAAGSLRFDGADITRATPEARARAGIGYVPQGRRIFRSLSVDEHLSMVRRRGGAWTPARIYETFPRLKERRRNLGDRLSGGEQQMLAISRALLLDPTLLVLDEPTEGLAPAIVSDVIDLLRTLSADGMAILLIEQNMHAALAVADEVAIMVNGRIVDRLAAAALAADPALQKRHLGLEPGQGGNEGRAA